MLKNITLMAILRKYKALSPIKNIQIHAKISRNSYPIVEFAHFLDKNTNKNKYLDNNIAT